MQYLSYSNGWEFLKTDFIWKNQAIIGLHNPKHLYRSGKNGWEHNHRRDISSKSLHYKFKKQRLFNLEAVSQHKNIIKNIKDLKNTIHLT